MDIRFVQAEFATHYTTTIAVSEAATYRWTLIPPSVDPACDNHGVVTSITSEFIWHHPSAIDSVPYNYYHCNHNVEGLEGHLGTVSVVATGGYYTVSGATKPSWRCTASYLGTNAPNGAPNYTVPMKCESLVAVAPTSSPSSGAPVGLIVGGIAVVAALGALVVVKRRATADDCAELRRRCEELKAAAASKAPRVRSW